MKNKIIKFLEENDYTCDGYPILWGSKYIAWKLGLSLCRTKKNLRELRKEKKVFWTYIIPPCTCYLGVGCECERTPPIWGWSITKYNR